MMKKNKHTKIWLIWTAFMALSIAYLSFTLLAGKDKSIFMPGELTGGHHQIGLACDACHSESFTDRDTIQKKCESCHGEQRKKPFDSHPVSKFKDPRNAERLKNINALYCVSCHTEHQPERTDRMGVSQPEDFCVHCHSDIAKDRPSHKDMEFNTCNSAGCHNYHNNRAIYTDFLVKHASENPVLDNVSVPKKEFASVLADITDYPHDRYPQTVLTLKDIDAPSTVIVKANPDIRHDWENTAHAKSGVNCSACHLKQNETSSKTDWTNKPDEKICSQCHGVEVGAFKQGKHGMRLAQNLSPMTPSMARLPMKQDAAHEELGCNSCHKAHDYRVDTAAVDACLGCHEDSHSLAYKKSPHFGLWQQELAGEIPQGSGVSCATCHMPRISVDVSDWLRRTVVQHNQNATLSPNEKMIRPACMNCHGLGFSIDSLADKTLIDNNFNGKPSVHIKSIEMAEKDNLRAQKKNAE